MDFEFRDQQEIKHTKGIVIAMHHNSPARGRSRNEIAVLHEENTTIGHVNGKWPKRGCVKYVFELFNRHSPTIPFATPSA